MNDVLIDEIYKLFNESEDGIYVGSRDQIRLAIQLKINSFIPMSYLDKVFKTFISSGLIIKLEKGKPIERQIGKRYYKLQTQRAYCINKDIDIEDREKILESITIVIRDLKKKYSEMDLELVLDSDIQKLRELENIKGITLSGLLGRNSPHSGFKFSDEEFLYDVSKSTILEYINRLEKYNPNEIEEELETDEKERIEKEKFENKVYNECIKVIEKALVFDITIGMQLYKSKGGYYDISDPIGKFKVDKIALEDNHLIITDDNSYKITVMKTALDININQNTISIIDENLEYRFLITKALYEDMRLLIEMYRKLLSCKYI